MILMQALKLPFDLMSNVKGGTSQQHWPQWLLCVCVVHVGGRLCVSDVPGQS